jgi:hypothetical protein
MISVQGKMSVTVLICSLHQMKKDEGANRKHKSQS